MSAGSSPRMRGTRPAAARDVLASVHPPRAGNTSGVTYQAGGHGSSPRMRGTPPWLVSEPPFAPVHPRVCGEHTALRIAIFHRFIPAHAGNTPNRSNRSRSVTGSSPRMRGTPMRTVDHEYALRFIPAHAGNTCRITLVNRCLVAGSSPRMRGTHRHRPKSSARRFIPAHAGNTTHRSARAHVRLGSSPRMRGTLIVLISLAMVARFIPAHAGNTVRGARSALGRFIPAHAGNTAVRWHPMPSFTRFIPACAGNTPDLTVWPRARGSSPRMRGTQPCSHRALRGRRFIPACAGNTHPRRLWPSAPVHPRVCGEHYQPTHCRKAVVGSSPRVRGTPSQAIDRPVRAFGSSPRVRGTRAAGRLEPRCLGSSPRVRGTRILHRAPIRRTRFIPACAGNPTGGHCPAA